MQEKLENTFSEWKLYMANIVCKKCFCFKLIPETLLVKLL
jgi:hypothetical protein